MLDPDIAVLPPAEGFQSLPKRDDTRQHFGVVLGVSVQERDASHALALLRARRERPRYSRAAEQRDERAPLHHSITSSARPSSIGGTVRPIVLAVFRLITSSNLVGCWTGRSAGFSPMNMR